MMKVRLMNMTLRLGLSLLHSLIVLENTWLSLR